MKSIALQIFCLLLAVYVGWEIISLVILPKGSNWMWVMEMHYFSAVVLVLIFIGHYFKSILGEKKLHYATIGQVVIILLFCLLMSQARPLRYSYLFLCALCVFVSPFFTRHQ